MSLKFLKTETAKKTQNKSVYSQKQHTGKASTIAVHILAFMGCNIKNLHNNRTAVWTEECLITLIILPFIKNNLIIKIIYFIHLLGMIGILKGKKKTYYSSQLAAFSSIEINILSFSCYGPSLLFDILFLI